MILTKEQVDEIFEKNSHQSDVTIALYALVVPNWNDVAQMNGYPTVGKELSDYIWKKFIRFDQKNHPNVMAGGMWMNNGFSSVDNEKLQDWEVQVNCEIEYK